MDTTLTLKCQCVLANFSSISFIFASTFEQIDILLRCVVFSVLYSQLNAPVRIRDLLLSFACQCLQ